MTDLPPSSDTPESENGTPSQTPAEQKKAKKRKRSLLRSIAVFSGIGVGALIGLGVVALIGGRYYLVSDAGRELISGFVQGKSIGRYGAINVEGLKGDLFSDFTLSRVTVTDKDGVWLEARDVRVDWNYWSLLARRFHADEISAKTINLIRRPELEPPTEPSGPQPLTVDIDKFSADVQLMEDFSKEYGHWRLAGKVGLPRQGNKDIHLDALSLSRPGDFLKVQAVLSDKPEDLRLNLQAQEAKGGPLAGSLGYSPDQPFSAVGLIDGKTVNLTMKTGQFTPLRVRGQFSEQNSFMSGYADFSGSEIMAPLAQRFGQTARIGLAAAPDSKREGYQALAWKLVADNITTTASGYVRVKDGTFADNIKLRVSTPSLSRLAGTELGDATTYEGTFRGDGKTFDLKGNADIANAHVAGYRLNRLSGPLSLSAKDQAYTLSGEVAGLGGSTQGLLGGLLGRAPRLDFELSRLKDGNILLQDVDLKGSALNLKGSGRRNLLGGLSFNADLDLNNVGVLKQGATGQLSGKLRGNMARSGAPWSLNFDGGGRNFALGIAEVDRLLGKSPKLNLNSTLNRGVLTLTEGSRLNGEKANVSASGVLIGSDLGLKLQWDATGPFGFGPVIIDADRARTVKINGTGDITGKLNTPQIRFLADIPRAAIGKLILHNVDLALTFNVGNPASHGNVRLTGTSNTNPPQQARAYADFRFGKDVIQLNNVDVDAGGITAKGDIALSQLVPTTADLVVTGRPGAFIQTGALSGTIKIAADSSGNTADIDLRARNLMFRGTSMQFSRISVKGSGNLDNLRLDTDLATTGENPISFKGPLFYKRLLEGRDLGNGHRLEATGNAVFRGVPATLNQGTYFQQIGDRREAKIDATIGSGTANFTFEPTPNNNSGWKATLALNQVPLSALNRDLNGHITGTGNLDKTSDKHLSGGAELHFVNVGSSANQSTTSDALIDGFMKVDLQADNMIVNACANYQNLTASCDADGKAKSGQTPFALLDLTLPMINETVKVKLVTDTNRDLDGELVIAGDVRPLFDLVDGVDRRLSGQMNASVKLGGRVRAPTVAGNVFLTNASFDEASTGLHLKKLYLDAAFDRSGVKLSNLYAQDRGSGEICGNGMLRFDASNAPLPEDPVRDKSMTKSPQAESCIPQQGNTNQRSLGNLSITLNNFEMVKNDVAEIVTSGNVNITRNAQRITIGGALDVVKADIKPNMPGSNGIVRAPVTDRNAAPRQVPTRRNATPLLSTPIFLNVTLNAENIAIKGRGLDLQMRTNARVGGTIDNPQLIGTANVVRGDYDFAGNRFAFDEDGSVTLSTDPSRIRLNLTATREDPSLTAIIRVTGTAAQPRIALSSDPVLPQDEILSRVLFGRSVSQLSAIEAAQLASGVASLAGGGGLDVIGGIREMAGLDRLSFGGEASNMTIAGGRRITDNLYLEIIGGGENGATVRVEWQVRRNFSITSSFSGDNSTNIAIRWRQERD